MSEQVVDKLIINIDVTGNARNEINNINKQLNNMGKAGKENISGQGANSLLSSFSLLAGKIAIVGYTLKKTISFFSSFVNESTAYTENLNLFRITFGEMANEAERFSNTFANALGLDVSQVMRNMGFFNQIATGFGLIEDKAYKMSQTLTQISYDISSFFDISIEDSISKVQSGLAGELEPLRRIGYALDQATLQQLAYTLGIQKSIREMTQAEKAQLRTIAIYEQSKNVMGDLAGTIESPANQLRILRQQFTLLSRSIGNIVVPILTKVLPYINGAIQGLTTVFNEVAKIFGFEIGEGVRDTANDIASVGEAVDNTINSTKKLLLPFDDFLSLTSQLENTANDYSFDLDIPSYDALAGLNKMSSIADSIANTIRDIFLEFDENGAIKGFKQEWLDIFEIIKNVGMIVYSTTMPIIKEFINSLNKIMPYVNKALSFIIDKIDIINALWSIFTEMSLWFLSPLSQILRYWEKIEEVLSFIGGFIGALFQGFKYLFNLIGTFIFNITDSMGGFLNKIINGLFGKIGNFNPIMPTLGVVGYDTGGFTPEVTGSLFQAGENGRPELMGSVRGKNAVANVQSIESAMENAAYRGMARALSSTSSAQQGSQKDIVLNIDGKELTRATVKNMASELNKNYRVNFATR